MRVLEADAERATPCVARREGGLPAELDQPEGGVVLGRRIQGADEASAKRRLLPRLRESRHYQTLAGPNVAHGSRGADPLRAGRDDEPTVTR